MITWFKVTRRGGVHMRTAEELVANLAFEDGPVRLFNWDGDMATADTIIGIMCLGIKQGDKLGIDFPETPRQSMDVYHEILNAEDGERAGTYFPVGMTKDDRESAIEMEAFFPADKKE